MLCSPRCGRADPARTGRCQPLSWPPTILTVQLAGVARPSSGRTERSSTPAPGPPLLHPHMGGTGPRKIHPNDGRSVRGPPAGASVRRPVRERTERKCAFTGYCSNASHHHCGSFVASGRPDRRRTAPRRRKQYLRRTVNGSTPAIINCPVSAAPAAAMPHTQQAVIPAIPPPQRMGCAWITHGTSGASEHWQSLSGWERASYGRRASHSPSRPTAVARRVRAPTAQAPGTPTHPAPRPPGMMRRVHSRTGNLPTRTTRTPRSPFRS